LLNERLISRLLIKSVKVEGNRVSAAELLRDVRGVERLEISHVRVKQMLYIPLNLLYRFL
jgi:hypothetical protein